MKYILKNCRRFGAPLKSQNCLSENISRDTSPAFAKMSAEKIPEFKFNEHVLNALGRPVTEDEARQLYVRLEAGPSNKTGLNGPFVCLICSKSQPLLEFVNMGPASAHLDSCISLYRGLR